MDTDHVEDNQGPDSSLPNHAPTPPVSPREGLAGSAARTLPAIPTGLVIIKRHHHKGCTRNRRLPGSYHHARQPIRSLAELMRDCSVNQVSMARPSSSSSSSASPSLVALDAPLPLTVTQQTVADLRLPMTACASCKVVHTSVSATTATPQQLMAHFAPNFGRRTRRRHRHRLRTRSENYDDGSGHARGSNLDRIINELPFDARSLDPDNLDGLASYNPYASPNNNAPATEEEGEGEEGEEEEEDENARCYFITTHKYSPGISVTKIAMPPGGQRHDLMRLGNEVATALMGQPAANLRNITNSEVDSVSKSIQNMTVDDQ